MQCGTRRRRNCRSHMNQPSQEGGGAGGRGTGLSNAAKRQQQGRTAWTQQDGGSKGQSGIDLGVNYKLQWFKKEWEEEKSRENNNLLHREQKMG